MAISKKKNKHKRILRPGKTFVNPLNKQLGRRTGRNFRAGRNIRVGKDGLENFDDYLSESDADSICLSDIHEQSGRTTDGNKENETTNTQSVMFQSVPLPDKGSMVSNSTADSIGVTHNSQLSMMKHSRFDWLRNRDIGRRTGKDMRANRQIRVDKNGMENFDDYLSESDAESFLSASSCKRRTSEKMAIQRKTLDSPDQCKSNRVRGEKSPENGGFHDHVEMGQQVTNSPAADSNRTNSEKKRVNMSENSKSKSSNLSNGTVISRNNDEGTDGVIYLESTHKNVDRNRYVSWTGSKGDKGGTNKELEAEMESDHKSITGDRHQTRNKVIDKSHVNRLNHIDRKDNKEGREHEKTTDDIENNFDESVDTDVYDEQVNENSSEKDDGNNIVNDDEDFPDNDEDDPDNDEDDPDNDEEDESNYEGEDYTGSESQSKSDECESEENDSEDEDFKDNDDDQDRENVLENSKLDQYKSKHSIKSRSKSGDVNPKANDKESDASEYLAVNDKKKEGSSQALSGLDVAGNKSGSITKRVDPGTAVSFNRTKKRLSYSALEASAESKKARAQRVEIANSELANQDCQGVTVKQPHLDEQLSSNRKPIIDLPHKIVKKPAEAIKNAVTMDEDNFLCLSTRSLHTAHLRHTKLSEDEDTDISIVDDARTHFVKKKSLTATKTKKSLKNTVKENVSKSVGRLKGSGSYSKRTKSQLPRKSVTKQEVKKAKTVVDRQEKRCISNQSKSEKRNKKIGKKVLDEMDHCDDDSNKTENHFSVSEQELKNEHSYTDTQQKYQSRKKDNSLGKYTSKVPQTVRNKLAETSLNRIRRTVRKNSVSAERTLTEKMQIERNHKESSKKRKSSSGESTDKESDGRETIVAKKKKDTKPNARKTNLQGSTDENISQQCGSPTEVPAQTPDPDSRLVSAGLKSGKSFRVSRRTEILETIASGPLSRVTDVELEPKNGLTPCITKKGQPRKSKGRRVTIDPEENVHYQLSDDEGILGQEKSVPNRFRHTMGLADVGTPLPSPSTTPVHIFECTQSDSPTSVSKLPKGYDELPVEDRCIRPVPAPDGLRRSQRVRLKPVAWYKNEEIIWDFKPDIGPVIVGVKPSMEIVYKKKEEIRRRKRQLKNALIKATKGKKRKSYRKLSIHAKLPDDFSPVDQDDIPVINPDTQEEDGIECIAYRDSVMAVGPTGESLKSTDPFSVTKLFDQPCMSAGTLDIMPLAAKPESRVSEQALLFRILEGKLLVKIHNTTALLETDDTFFVPYGNTYSLTNLRNDRAQVFYTVHKFFDNDQSSIVK